MESVAKNFSKMHDKCAIIVTYNPNADNVSKLIKRLETQHTDYLIIDNSDKEIGEFNSGRYIWLGSNKGIAKAQNVGISIALDLKYEYIIFFDQDSSIVDGFMSELLNNMVNYNFEICAPAFFDERYGFEYAITDVDKKGRRNKLFSEGRTEPFTSSLAISSGTLVKKDVFEKVGLMDERLFIDYVDTEWCLRCFYKGIKVNIIPSAKMYHSIGDNSIKLWRFRIPVHSAVRRYYRTRNAIHLLRYKHVPTRMALREIFFSMVHNVILLFTICNLSYLKQTIYGLIDGISNRWGENKHS